MFKHETDSLGCAPESNMLSINYTPRRKNFLSDHKADKWSTAPRSRMGPNGSICRCVSEKCPQETNTKSTSSENPMGPNAAQPAPSWRRLSDHQAKLLFDALHLKKKTQTRICCKHKYGCLILGNLVEQVTRKTHPMCIYPSCKEIK